MDQYVEALERRVADLEILMSRSSTPGHQLGITDVPAPAFAGVNSGKTPGVWQTPGVSREYERRLTDLEKAVLTLTDAVEKLVGKSPVPAKKTIIPQVRNLRDDQK
ncbi:MAG: hypothetical protein HY783_04650 [Chloroflexi bacterium]|nr:hypothetical protein [Chloroflexota bacterium]